MAITSRKWLCLALLLTGPVQANSCPSHELMRPLLNSERIEACFGSYGVEVLRQENNIRVSRLYSEQDGEPVSRTLAVTKFSKVEDPELTAALVQIQAGASIGSTLATHGWLVEKRPLFFGDIEIPTSLGDPMNSGTGSSCTESSSAVYVYELWAHKDQSDAYFAVIAEAYDPCYLTLADLREIYGAQTSTLNNASQEVSELLKMLRE